MKITTLMENADMVIDSVRNSTFYDTYHGILLKGVHGAKTAQFPFKERGVPRDTWIPYHNTVNQKSQELFGINVRNLLFVSTDISQASGYGEPVHIFAVGHYRMFIAHGHKDMTNSLYAFTSDVLKSLKRFIEDDLTTYLSVSPDYFDTLTNNTKYLSSLVSKPNTTTFDLAGALAYIKSRLMDDVKFDLERNGDLADNFETLFTKAFDEFYHEKFVTPVDGYINSLTEVDSVSELHDHTGEVMLYSPDGVYAVTQEDYQWDLASR